jgi:hypothetical protein
MSLLEKKLLEKGVITDFIYRKAAFISRKYGGTIPLNLVRINAIVEDDLLDFVTSTLSIPSVGMERLSEITLSILNIVPTELAKRFRLIPFGTTQDVVKVIMSDPTDEKIIEEVAFITGRTVQVYCALESVISWALLKYYGVITESGNELSDITRPESVGEEREREEGEIPIPLVTRKKSDTRPEADAKTGAPPAAEGAGERMSEMGDWEAPFELSRTSTVDIDFPVPPEKELSAPKRYKRKTPTKLAIPRPDTPEVTAEQFPGAPAAPAEEKPAAVKADDDGEPSRQDRDSSVSISPVYIIGSTSTVAETIRSPFPDAPPVKRRPSPVKQQTVPPSPSAQPAGQVSRAIDRSRVDRWAAFIATLSDTEKIIERTLSFLDTVFGPTIFLRKKKDILEPYRFSLSIPVTQQDKLKAYPIGRQGFDELWACLDRGHFSLVEIPSRREYKPIVAVNVDAGWEDKTLVLMIPIVLGGMQMGVLLAVPAREWGDSPQLQENFSVIEATLSRVFSKLIMERKKGGHGKE